MHPDEIIFYKIEDYLLGRLSPVDRAAFESDMAADAALAALVQRQKQENQALELLAERDLRARMNAWERQVPAALTPAGGRYRLKWLRWAAAAAMIVFVAGWWLIRQTGPVEAPVAVRPETPASSPKTTPAPKQQERRPDPQPPKEVITDASKRPAPAPKPAPSTEIKKTVDYAALADEFYREPDFFPSQGSGTGAAGYDQALQDFKNGRYSDILPKLRPGGKLDSKDLKNKELLAHSLLKSRQYDAAIATFRELVNSRKQPYADRAYWAMALTYLRQMPERRNELNQVLRNIAARPNHLFYNEARALQARLGEG